MWKLSSAIKTLELQTVNNPENINLLTLLGNILAEAENWAACLDVWEKVKQINPNRPELVSKIANCLLKMNRLSEAEVLLQESIVENSDDCLLYTSDAADD